MRKAFWLSTEHGRNRGLEPNLTGNKSSDRSLDQGFSLQVEIFRDINMDFLEKQNNVTTLQIGSYRGLDSSPYGIRSGNHIEDRPVYLVYYR